VSDEDVLFGFRLRLFSLAGEIGVRPACRAMGVHHSTYYRWKRRVDRWGLEALRVRERRRPRMPNELGPRLEQRILAFSLAHRGLGPSRVSAELAREKWGGLRISPNGVWRCLRRHGLNTRGKRLSLVAGYAAAYERTPAEPEPERHVDGHPPRRAGRARLLLRRPARRHQGRGLAVDGDRRRLRLRLGRAALLAPQPARPAPLGARPSRRLRARPRRQAANERARRTPAADDPRAVLAALLRPLTRTQADRARTRPQAVPRPLQPRPRPHRPPHPRQSPRRDRLRCPQGETEISDRRYISWSGQARCAEARRYGLRSPANVE
jgi:transposase